MSLNLYKPTIVKQNSAKRTHMSRVDEHQILNGHYVRLRSAKSAIDIATPRSQHTLATIRRQQTPNNSKRNNSSTIEISQPNRSRSMEMKRTTSELTITKINERNLSPPNMQNANFKPMSMMEIRRIQLSQSMTMKPKRIFETVLSKSFNYGPYVKGRTMSNQYERRFLDLDVMDRKFYLFNQPNKPFNPRQLLFNVQQSKVANMRVYNPPAKRRGKNMNLSKTWHGQNILDHENRSDFLDESNSHLSESLRHIQRERLSPNAFYLKRPSRSDLSFTKPNLSKDELDEIMSWNFLREVTENVIVAQTYTDTALYQIFERSIENWKMKLPITKLKSLLSKLLDDLYIKKEGALSIFEEPKDFVKPLINEPSEVYDYTDPEEVEEEEKSVELTENSNEEEKVESKRSDISAKSSKKLAIKEISKIPTPKTKLSKLPKLVQIEHSESEIEEEVEGEDEEIENEENEEQTPRHRAHVSRDDEPEPFEESVADSHVQSPIVKSFKEQDVSNAESVFDNDKSSEATMGEVSDIEDDDNSMLSQKIQPKNNKSKPKLEDFKQQNNVKSNAKVKKNPRKYSWESSESEKVPVKEIIQKETGRKKVEQDMLPITVVEKQLVDHKVPPLGPREDTLQSLNDEFQSSKPKERRRWWPSSREGSMNSSYPPPETSIAHENDAKVDQMVIDEIRKKREPFLQKLEENKSGSDRSAEGAQNSSSSSKNGTKQVNNEPLSETIKENKDLMIEEQEDLPISRSETKIKNPVPAKRNSLSRSSTPDKNFIENKIRDKKSTINAESEDDDGVFYIPEDSTLRGDYGGRRLSQVINQIATEPEHPSEYKKFQSRHSLTRSPRLSSTDENSNFKEQTEKRRTSNASTLRANPQPATIYEGDETNSIADQQKLKQKYDEEKSESGEDQTESKSGENSTSELQMTKTTKVLKNALNTLALDITSDESDKDDG